MIYMYVLVWGGVLDVFYYGISIYAMYIHSMYKLERIVMKERRFLFN